MENNIENTRVEAKVYTNQTSIFIVIVFKCQKPRPFNVSFVLTGDVYKFPRDHATVKFHKPRFSTESLPIILHEIQQ